MEIHLFENIISIRYEQFNEKQKNVLNELKGKMLNELPVIGSFCVEKCFLDSVIINFEYIEYNICFFEESFIYEEEIPKKVISKTKVCCKQYFNKEMLVIVSKDEKFIKAALNIILNIPNYIKLKVNSEFSYIQYKAKDITFTIDELKVIQYIFKEKLIIRYKCIKDKNIPIIDFLSYKDVYDDNVYTLKYIQIKGNKKACEFYYFNNERKKNRMIVNVNGMIYSDVLINKNIIDEIVTIIYFILKKQNAKEFLFSIDRIMDEYCSFIHSEMLAEGKMRQKRLILSELQQFIENEFENNNFKVKVSETYITVIFNLLIKFMLPNQNMEKCTMPLEDIECSMEGENIKNKINIEEYESLRSFLKKYSLRKYNKVIHDEHLIKVFLKLGIIIKLSKGEVETLMTILKVS